MHNVGYLACRKRTGHHKSMHEDEKHNEIEQNAQFNANIDANHAITCRYSIVKCAVLFKCKAKAFTLRLQHNPRTYDQLNPLFSETISLSDFKQCCIQKLFTCDAATNRLQDAGAEEAEANISN